MLRLRAQDQRCSICNEILGLPGSNGISEDAVMLPCSHTFGNLCISRWLIEAPNHDCPHCRRKMIYRGCGHLIGPCDISQADTCVSKRDLPEKCAICKSRARLEPELRMETERRSLGRDLLENLIVHLPRVFVGKHRVDLNSLDERSGNTYSPWNIDLDALCRAFVEKEERAQW